MKKSLFNTWGDIGDLIMFANVLDSIILSKGQMFSNGIIEKKKIRDTKMDDFFERIRDTIDYNAVKAESILRNCFSSAKSNVDSHVYISILPSSKKKKYK